MAKPNSGPDFYLFDPNLGPILAGYGPNLVPKNFFVGFTSTRCYGLLQAIIVCNLKGN